MLIIHAMVQVFIQSSTAIYKLEAILDIVQMIIVNNLMFIHGCFWSVVRICSHNLSVTSSFLDVDTYHQSQIAQAW